MNFSKINYFCACIVSLVFIAPVHNAPRSRHHSSTKYYQNQTGDFNVQVHLKDFHFIAIVGDDALGGPGDLDYNYDYSDLTIKPSLSSTTTTPSPDSPIVNISESSNVVKPAMEASEASQATSENPPLSSDSALNGNATTPETPPASTANPQESNTAVTQKPKVSSSVTVTTQKGQLPEKTTKLENSEENLDKKTESSVTNISIVPAGTAGSVQKDQHLPRGEILHYRKCAEGYARDKQGRCRKHRWTPQLPFGLSRFASSLATRFRQAAAAKA